MAVLVCCVSVGSRKVRLGKFGQGGLGGVRHHLSWFGGLGKAGQREASPDWVGIGMARLGSYGLMWSGEFWLNMAGSGMAVEAGHVNGALRHGEFS